MTVYYWDFFGPDAEGTAQHFLRHLAEYLERGSVQGCDSGLESARAGHSAVWCRAPDEARAAIVRLKPRRAAPVA